MKNSKLLFLGLVLVLAGSITASLVQCGNGSIKVIDVVITSKAGNPINATMFIPKNATEETPAPAMITYHGYVNKKENQIPFALELARRGYVVVAPDLSGHGGSGTSMADLTRGASDVLRYVHTLPFVDKKNVGLEGQSMGGWSTCTAAVQNPELVRHLVMVASAPGGVGILPIEAPEIPEGSGFNFGVSVGKYDEFVPINYWDVKKGVDFVKSSFLMKPFGTTEPVVLGKLYGDFAAGTGRIALQTNDTHAGSFQSYDAVAAVLKIVALSSPAPVQRDLMDQVWLYKELGTLVAFIGLFIFMFGVAIKLFSLQFFSQLVQRPNKNKPMHKGLYFTIVVLIIATAAYLLVPFEQFALFKFGASPLFPFPIGNAMILFLLLIQVIFLVLFLIWHFAFGKKNGENAISYGISTSTSKSAFDLGYIGKGFILALTTVASGYTLLSVVLWLFNVDAGYFIFRIRALEAYRFADAIPYILPYFIIFFINSIIAFGWLRLKDFGSDTKNGVIWTIMVFLANAGGVLTVLFLQYGTGYITGQAFWGTTGFDTLMVILAHDFVPFLAVTSLMCVYSFRKTGNIFTGAFISAMIATWMMCGVQAYF